MRKIESLNEGWFFTKEEQKDFPNDRTGAWERIELPHTWNALDGQDGGADYYRGMGYYFKDIFLPKADEERKYYLEIGAASYDCMVYFNSELVTEHRGGYSAFSADITPKLREGNNEIAIIVSNSTTNDIYPQMADFTFYGGLHRGIRLISVPKAHFETEYLCCDGLEVSSKVQNVEKCEKCNDCGCRLLGDAKIKLNSRLKNTDETDTVFYSVTDTEGRAVFEAYCLASMCELEADIKNVRLWNGIKDPYLYTVTARLIRHNEVIDEVSVLHGFRSFRIDAGQGFYLNGELMPLRGVSRHQDKCGIGNALKLEDHITDARLIRELGANTVRLAHYQQSREFYELCDRYGFIVWAEIPFISSMLHGRAAQENALSQLRELIMQNYNHSSICVWGIANEITIGGGSAELTENICELNALAKSLDASRLTAIAQMTNTPQDDPLNFITDLLSYNHYFGWYVGKLTDNEAWIDEFHKRYPDRPLGLSEYGCEGIVTYHGDEPCAGDYTEEYQAVYHEHMLSIIKARPWIWASHIWNMFDFGCDARDEGGVKGHNNKGLISIDRKIKKDAFYLYKAAWSDEAFVHICGKRYFYRASADVKIKVYSNLPLVKLFLNDEECRLKEARSDIGAYIFEVKLNNKGLNLLTAYGYAECECDRCDCGGESICTDVASLFRTDNVPEAYILKTDPSEIGVTNWFEGKSGEAFEMTFDERFYSIRDSIAELLKNDRAGKVLIDAFSSASGMKLKRSMLMMMADQTPETLFPQFSSSINVKPDEILRIINAELQRIHK